VKDAANVPPARTGGHTPKGHARGTHRLVPPAETLARVRPLLAGCGITRVADVTGLDHVGIPVMQAIRPNGRSLSVHQGKGVDREACRASAVMEAIEHHHAERPRLPLRWSSAEDLAAEPGAPAIVADDLPRFARPWRPDTKVLWAPARGLRSERAGLVPYELVHLDFTLPLPPGSGHFLGGSNGLASGNHPLEAIAHGLDELVERDALTLFYLLPADAQAARRMDPDSVHDPVCRALLDRYARARITVGIWDATSDVGIPVFLAAIADADGGDPFRPIGVARGSGCHPDRGVALARALTEAAQSRLVHVTGSRDDVSAAGHARHRSPSALAQAARQLATSDRPPRRFADVPQHQAPSFEDDVALLLERLGAVGLPEPWVVDLSRPDEPIHVVRVLAPGLEGTSDNPGWRPGVRAAARLAAPERAP
jgi:ribosomal protein S12 methylthiotransferase accessory factor